MPRSVGAWKLDNLGGQRVQNRRASIDCVFTRKLVVLLGGRLGLHKVRVGNRFVSGRHAKPDFGREGSGAHLPFGIAEGRLREDISEPKARGCVGVVGYPEPDSCDGRDPFAVFPRHGAGARRQSRRSAGQSD